MVKTTSKTTTKKKKTVSARTKKPATKSVTAPKAAKVTKRPVAKSEKASIATKASSKKVSKKITTASLYTWNRVLAGLHFVQGVAILLLSTTQTLPVTTSFITEDTFATRADGSPILVNATDHIFDVNLAYLIAAFFFLSAAAHLIVATVYKRRYERELEQGINRARWFEYGLSASTMIVAIGLLTGVTDISTLFALFMLTLVMNLCGLAMEVSNQGKTKPSWLTFVIGSIAGIVPWIVFAIYLIGSNVLGSGGVPFFVYAIYASLLLFFFSFAFNMYLQYKKSGKWQNYLYGERTYMILSLVAKSALAWQIFAGTLRP